jgi:hypothetical protein
VLGSGAPQGIVKPRTWARYRTLVNPGIERLGKSKRPWARTVRNWLAPRLPEDAYEVSYRTAFGGDPLPVDFFRNFRRPSKHPSTDPDAHLSDPGPRLTMERALQPLGYRIVAGGNPTNPKERGKRENKMQLADLFIINKYWRTALSGIVAPGTGEVRRVDDEALHATRTYWKISDHSPVAMVGSSDREGVGAYQAFGPARGGRRRGTEAEPGRVGQLR